MERVLLWSIETGGWNRLPKERATLDSVHSPFSVVDDKGKNDGEESTMLKIRHILFPTDFSSCAQEALGPALALAESHGAELHLFHALVLLADDPHSPWHRFPDPEQVERDLLVLGERHMQKVLRKERNHAVPIHTEQRRSISPLKAIVEYSDEKEIDLIVMGTHGRGALGRLLVGSVAREVVRMAACPVLTVREHGPTKSVFAPRKILVPVDFSEHSALALKHARELARSYGGRMQVLHVVEEALYPDFYYPVLHAPRVLTSEIREELARKVESWLSADAAIRDADVHVSTGRAVREITDFADAHGSDLIVLASHGRTGLQRMLLGSVAEGVVSRAGCPVLTVKAFGRHILEARDLNGSSESGPVAAA